MIKAQINDNELNSHIDSLEKDGLSIFVMADGRARGALFHGTRFVNQMRSQHNLGILETMVLGQASINLCRSYDSHDERKGASYLAL